MSGNDNKSTDKTLLLTTNHNYFVRQAISTFCGLVVLTFIYAFIAIMCSSTIIEGATAAGVSSSSGFLLFSSLIYLLIVIVQISKIIALHAKVTAVEKELVPNGVYSSKK